MDAPAQGDMPEFFAGGRIQGGEVAVGTAGKALADLIFFVTLAENSNLSASCTDESEPRFFHGEFDLSRLIGPGDFRL